LSLSPGVSAGRSETAPGIAADQQQTKVISKNVP